MLSELELRKKLLQALHARISMGELGDWLLRERVDMHLDSTPEAQRLANQVTGRLFEYFDGFLPLELLLDDLWLLMRDTRVEIGGPPPQVVRSTATTQEARVKPELVLA